MGANAILTALAISFLAVGFYFFAGIRAESPNWHYDFESPAWAKLLVGAVYIGATLLFVWALLHGHSPAHHGA